MLFARLNPQFLSRAIKRTRGYLWNMRAADPSLDPLSTTTVSMSVSVCRARLSKQAGSRRSPLKFNTITVQRGLRVGPTGSDLCASDIESQIRGIADATLFLRLGNLTARGNYLRH